MGGGKFFSNFGSMIEVMNTLLLIISDRGHNKLFKFLHLAGIPVQQQNPITLHIL